MARTSTISQAALRAIRTHGPQPLEKLAQVVVEAGGTRAKDPLRAVEAALRYQRAFLEGRDGRVFSLSDQLEGTMFTRRLTSLERHYEMLVVDDDLALAMRLIDPYGRRGSPIHVGWLDDLLHTRSIDPDLLYAGDPSSVLRQVAPETIDLLVDFISQCSGTHASSEAEAVAQFLRYGNRQYMSTWSLGQTGAVRQQLVAVAVRDGVPTVEAVDYSAAYGPHVFAAASRLAEVAKHMRRADPGGGSGTTTPLEYLLAAVVTEVPGLLRQPLPPVRELIWLAGLDLEDGWIALREDALAA